MIGTKVPRMTKRIKTFKPKQTLSKSELQTLVTLVGARLNLTEWSIAHYKFLANSLKQDKELGNAEYYFKKLDKARNQRNKLAMIQAKLKRGLV